MIHCEYCGKTIDSQEKVAVIYNNGSRRYFHKKSDDLLILKETTPVVIDCYFLNVCHERRLPDLSVCKVGVLEQLLRQKK